MTFILGCDGDTKKDLTKNLLVITILVALYFLSDRAMKILTVMPVGTDSPIECMHKKVDFDIV